MVDQVAYVWRVALHGFSFATAVFIQYISGKLGKGKTKFETSLKLEDLERGVSWPFFAIREPIHLRATC